MEFATGLAVLYVGAALVWGAEPGRLPFAVPERPVRLLGVVLIAAALRWFVAGSGAIVGAIEWTISLSFVASTVALAAPLRPRAAVAATACAALLAVALEIAR